MRKLLVLSAFILSSTALNAAQVWVGPGWYQIADTIVGPFVWAGPYADEQSCRSVLPANEEDAEYSCEYLTTRPLWDDGI